MKCAQGAADSPPRSPSHISFDFSLVTFCIIGFSACRFFAPRLRGMKVSSNMCSSVSGRSGGDSSHLQQHLEDHRSH